MNRRHLLRVLGALGVGGSTFGPWPGTPTASGAANSGRRTDGGGRSPVTGSGAAAQSGIEAIVLGTAQDGGVPSINCFTGHCARVRSGDALAPRVASVGLADHDAERYFVIDATPDFSAQVGALLAPDGDAPESLAGRTVPLADHLHGVFLTHAHIGHYLGLAQLGKEVAAPDGVPVYASSAMASYLRANAPWEALERNGWVELREVRPGVPVQLTDRLTIEPFSVVHRPEYSDTVGYLVSGPERTLLCVPDADVWDGWTVPFEELLGRADTALLDGSFYSHDELGHRAQADVPHPPVSQTVERLRGMDDRPEIWFYHLNHTNPLWETDAPEHDALPDGFGVAREGQRFAL